MKPVKAPALLGGSGSSLVEDCAEGLLSPRALLSPTDHLSGGGVPYDFEELEEEEDALADW